MRCADRDTVLVVGHSAGTHLWGSERSLLDILDGFTVLQKNVCVVIPPGIIENPSYLEALCERSFVVRVERLPIRQLNRPVDEGVAARLCEIIRQDGVRAVHVNTIVLREPLVAARRCGVPAVLNAREIPQGDPDLCAWLGGSAEELQEQILGDTDFVVANSRATANAFPLSGRTSVVPNIIEVGRFHPRGAEAIGKVRIVLAGYFNEKKGITDFRWLAHRLLGVSDAQFTAIGPTTPLTEQLCREGIPANLEFAGYLPSAEEVMARADIVVSMSRIPESFGRTLLEAMGAGLPVVAFNQGGPSEIVVHGETGYLIPPGDLEAFAAAVEKLCAEPDSRSRLGVQGKRRAEAMFSAANLTQALREAYRVILPPHRVRTQSMHDVRIPLPTENRTSFAQAFFVGYRARFAHCTDVAFIDERTLVTASLLGKRGYLIDFDPQSGHGEVVAEIPTEGIAGEVSSDLLDVDPTRSLIVMADCEQQSATLYRRVGHRLVREKSVRVPAGGFCHGACFVPGAPDLVAVCVTTGDVGVHLLSLNQGIVVQSLRMPGWIPKASAFLSRIQVITAWAKHNVDQNPGAPHESKFTAIDLSAKHPSARVVAHLPLPGRSVDGIRVSQGRIFETDQIGNSINEWRIDAGTFHLERNYEGFSLPHGVALSPDGVWLAVAEYGTNSVALRRRQHLQERTRGPD